MQRRQDERRSRGRPPSEAAERRVVEDSRIDRILDLQSSAGNAAVASVLQRQPRGAATTQARRTYDRGSAAYDTGHYRRALRLWERLTTSPATTPEIMPDLVWNLAVTHARLGQVGDAMTAAMTYGQYRPQEQPRLLQLIEQIQRDQAHAEYDRATTAYDQGHYRRALRVFERLTSSPATTPEIMPELVWNIAATKARLGDLDGAMTAAMTYGQYRPHELAGLLALIDRVGHERATDAARRLYSLGEAAYERGNYRRALRLWEQLTESPATSREIMPELVWNIALSKARLGDIDGAMTAAMTYGQYRPAEQQQLIDRIQQVRARR